MSFIDLHSHLAWDIDDGIDSREEAQRALQQIAALIDRVVTLLIDHIQIIIIQKHFTATINRYTIRLTKLLQLPDSLIHLPYISFLLSSGYKMRWRRRL